jgi:hypothetical protein
MAGQPVFGQPSHKSAGNVEEGMFGDEPKQVPGRNKALKG